jgi:hypothetical protein
VAISEQPHGQPRCEWFSGVLSPVCDTPMVEFPADFIQDRCRFCPIDKLLRTVKRTGIADFCDQSLTEHGTNARNTDRDLEIRLILGKNSFYVTSSLNMFIFHENIALHSFPGV